MFVVFEGLDGVGKTTIAQRVAQEVSCKYISTPGSSLQSAREVFEGAVPSVASLFFYLSGVLLASDIVRAGLIKQAGFVCDRYLASTIAYHTAVGVELPVDLEALEVTEPDLTILLTAHEGVRRRRLATRADAPTAVEDLLTRSKLREVVIEELRRQSVNLVEIDTTRATIEEVVQEVLKILRQAEFFRSWSGC